MKFPIKLQSVLQPDLSLQLHAQLQARLQAKLQDLPRPPEVPLARHVRQGT